MMRTRLARDDLWLEDLNREEWHRAANNFADYNYENCYPYALSKSVSEGSIARFIAIRRGRDIIGLSSVRIKSLQALGTGTAYITGGPIIRPTLATSFDTSSLQLAIGALKSNLVEQANLILYVRPPVTPPVSPDIVRDAFHSLGFRHTNRVRSYSTVAIRLHPELSTLRKNLHQKWRYHLKNSESACPALEVGTDYSCQRNFLKLYNEMRANKNFQSGSDPALILSLGAEGGISVLLAKLSGRYVGGVVLSLLGSTAVYLLGATSDEGRKARVGYFLQWAALAYAKEMGFSWYDLCGIDQQTNPGGFQFKVQMGGEILQSLPYEIRPKRLIADCLDKAIGLRNLLVRLRDGKSISQRAS
jgi:hypothetical protein